MWARLSLIIGEYIGRVAVREAAKEVISKFGASAARKGFAELSKDLLKNGTKEEIIDAMGKVATSSGKEAINDTLFKINDIKSEIEKCNLITLNTKKEKEKKEKKWKKNK